jgi:hypothetical protein
MQYLKDHQEYLELGGVCDATAYARFSDRAFGIVDNATHNRIECMAEVPQRAKALCRDLVEYLANDFGSSKQISNHSQSAGGVSESESFVIRSIEERAGEIDDMVKYYLLNVVDDNGTPLLYRGCLR